MKIFEVGLYDDKGILLDCGRYLSRVKAEKILKTREALFPVGGDKFYHINTISIDVDIDIKELFELSDNDLDNLYDSLSTLKGTLFDSLSKVIAVRNGRVKG